MASKGLTEQNTQGSDDGSADLPFNTTLGGRELTITSPGSGALAILARSTTSSDPAKRAAGALNFIERRLAEEDREWFVEAMMEDEISLEDAMQMIGEAMEFWSEDPTKSSADSSRSQTRSGNSSMGSSRKRG